MLFSKTTNGFYDLEIHGQNVPVDAVEISSELYLALIDGQTMGKLIVSDENGYPFLVDQPVKAWSYAELRVAEYPPITDYIDGVVKGDQAQIDAYIAACKAVKSKYPKPE